MNITYRVFVSTDLGGDPDDIQSLYRIIHFSDICRFEGIISSPGPGAKNRASLIGNWIRRIDPDHLRRNGHSELQDEASLNACLRQGAVGTGGPAPGKNTEGSDLLIERASVNDGRIRLYSIGSSNTEADPESRDYVFRFMQEEYSEFWWIENGVLPKMSSDTFRGVYIGGYQQDEYAADRYITEVIRGRGSTHDGEFTERCGDVFPPANWPAGVLKEGDSPSFLYLLSSVLGRVGDVDDPTSESWGGSFRHFDAERFPNYYVDLAGGMEQCIATINKWRREFLDAWTVRWGWY